MKSYSAPPTQESTAAMIDAYTKGLPGLTEATNELFLPNELAQLEAAQAVSPGYAALSRDIYDTVGRDLNRIGTDIAAQNQLATAKGDLATIQATGKDLVRSYNEAAELVDPAYYSSRALLGDRLNEFLSSGANLTEGEMAQIERGVNRTNAGMSNANNPSPSVIAANAMTFGQAGQDRFERALAAATNAIPALRSGVDPFQMATGKTAGANTGDQRFIQPKLSAGEQVNQMGAGLLNQIGQTQRAAIDANSRKRTGVEQFGQLAGGLGNLFSFGI